MQIYYTQCDCVKMLTIRVTCKKKKTVNKCCIECVYVEIYIYEGLVSK